MSNEADIDPDEDETKLQRPSKKPRLSDCLESSLRSEPDTSSKVIVGRIEQSTQRNLDIETECEHCKTPSPPNAHQITPTALTTQPTLQDSKFKLKSLNENSQPKAEDVGHIASDLPLVSGHANGQNYQETDESEDEPDPDYAPILARILGEKKLALLMEPEMASLLRNVQLQMQTNNQPTK